jgi:hypothetical protein
LKPSPLIMATVQVAAGTLRLGWAWFPSSILLEANSALGRMTKAGQTDIRRLLIIGAMSRMNWLGQRTIVGAQLAIIAC